MDQKEREGERERLVDAAPSSCVSGDMNRQKCPAKTEYPCTHVPLKFPRSLSHFSPRFFVLFSGGVGAVQVFGRQSLSPSIGCKFGRFSNFGGQKKTGELANTERLPTHTIPQQQFALMPLSITRCNFSRWIFVRCTTPSTQTVVNSVSYVCQSVRPGTTPFVPMTKYTTPPWGRLHSTIAPPGGQAPASKCIQDVRKAVARELPEHVVSWWSK